MKLLSLACVVASASAFLAPAPAAPTRARGRVSMMAEKSKSIPFLPRPDKLDGSIAGDVGFDPVGTSFFFLSLSVFGREAEAAAAAPPSLLSPTHPPTHSITYTGFTNWLPVSYLQEAEIKHCRIAMLATLGWIVADFFHLPGTLPPTHLLSIPSSSFQPPPTPPLTHPPTHPPLHVYR